MFYQRATLQKVVLPLLLIFILELHKWHAECATTPASSVEENDEICSKHSGDVCACLAEPECTYSYIDKTCHAADECDKPDYKGFSTYFGSNDCVHGSSSKDYHLMRGGICLSHNQKQSGNCRTGNVQQSSSYQPQGSGFTFHSSMEMTVEPGRYEIKATIQNPRWAKGNIQLFNTTLNGVPITLKFHKEQFKNHTGDINVIISFEVKKGKLILKDYGQKWSSALQDGDTLEFPTFEKIKCAKIGDKSNMLHKFAMRQLKGK